MLHGTYVGDRKELQGQTALLRWVDEKLLAQFDDVSLQHLARDWHEFESSDFELDGEEDIACDFTLLD